MFAANDGDVSQPREREQDSPRFATIGEMLATWATVGDPRPAFVFLGDSPRSPPVSVTYARLYDEARRAAAGFAALGVRKGDRVVLVLPTGADFLYAFFGIVLAGGVPVPAYPPFGLGKVDVYLERLAHVCQSSQAAMLCTTRGLASISGEMLARAPGLRHIVTVSQLMRSGGKLEPVSLAGDDTLFLQYTSGSTGAPRGVELSHRNIIANAHAIGLGVGIRLGQEVGCVWLPLCHDMGLIGGILTSLYGRVSMVLMGPQTFISDPKRWVWGIHDYKARLSTAPNFAYELCARRIPEEDVRGLDLSSWRVALNGAEPVSLVSIDAFVRRFEKHGFRRTALTPVYGLAEATLAVTFSDLGSDYVIDDVEREALYRDGQARIAGPSAPSVRLVSVGRPGWQTDLRIVDDDGRSLPERQVGEIVLRGPSVMKGYFNDGDATARAIREGWLHTGDLGYLAGGRLFITGRRKDLIIKNGRNYYPQDLERAVDRIPGARSGCVAAFSVPV